MILLELALTLSAPAAAKIQYFVRLYSKFYFPVNQWHDCVKSVGIWSYSGRYLMQIRKNADQNNSKYGQFSRSAFYVIYFRKY